MFLYDDKNRTTGRHSGSHRPPEPRHFLPAEEDSISTAILNLPFRD
jgi:hypothetical protein